MKFKFFEVANEDLKGRTPAQPNAKRRIEMVQSCSCPRALVENIETPSCPVEKDIAASNTVIIVACQPENDCEKAIPFDSSHLCTCKNRIQVYRIFGI